MTNNCPDCGASMELEQREVRLRTGVCPSCSKEFAFVEGTTVASRLATPPSNAAEEGEGTTAVVAEGGPECEECGSPLQFREGHHGAIEAVCAECETTTVFVRKPEGRFADRERPPRSEGQGPRARPCRQCGAPLRFSTGDDGMVVGECDSCGNRFTLPPRPGGGGGGRSFGRRDFRQGPGGRPPYRGRGGDRPFRRVDRGGPSRYEEEGRPRKRRRPRDE